MAVAGLHKASTLDSYLGNKEKPTTTTRTSSIRKMWHDLESEGKCETLGDKDTNEIENECPQNQNQVAVHNGLCLQRSPSLDVPAKERVRKVFRDWGSKSFEGCYSSCMNNCSRAQSVEENECKRSIIRRIYGRQAVLDLLAKFVREREREVKDLLENQFVSHFAHRHRIQSLLKGRFLRNQRFVEDQKQASVAASELGLLRQTHSVSDIRKGFLSKLNNYDKNAPEVTQSDSDNDNIEQAEEIIHEIGEEFQSTNLTSNQEAYNPQQFCCSSQLGERHDDDNFIMQYEEGDDSVEETNQNTHHAEFPQGSQVDEVVHLLSLQTSTDSLNWQEISQAEEEWDESVTEDDESEWHHLTRTNSDEGIDVNSPVRSDSQESHEEWIETIESRSNAFYWFDDDDNNDNRFELTQLTNRRTVSNLLQSDFGARLDQLLMQSYVNRQNQAFELQQNEAVVIPQTQEEREIINGLRVDMDALQERMNEMQRMLEACVDMQKSVHQELNSALNQSSSCYLCCDDGFESLPDRSGAHMCICSKCAQKINWSKLKESVR